MTSLPLLNASAFPEATPLNAFFAWNEARRRPDRRYRVACDIHRLRQGCGDEICLAHLAGQPLGLRRAAATIVAPSQAASAARQFLAGAGHSPSVVAGRRLVDALQSAIGSPEIACHAAVFRAFEELARHIDLDALAHLRSQLRIRSPQPRRRILIVKLGALGDFIQALGPMPEVRRHHADDYLALLTTRRYAEIARQTGLFDGVIVDRRPRAFDLRGWLALRRMLRRGGFDRVYDFQTSDRSNIYSWLLRPGRRTEWSGTAWHCSHPHANLDRDQLHTMDRQAEQLLMAGIYPVSLIPKLPAVGLLPPTLAGRRFAMLIPGSSPTRPEKRWPAKRFGEVARRLVRSGYLPVVVGVAGEEALGRAILARCPKALDLVGRTDVAGLAALARAAALTIGNDTGATHVAAAGRHPVVVLFSRASDPGLCAPRGAAVRVLIEPDLSALTVATVLAAALSALASSEMSAAAR